MPDKIRVVIVEDEPLLRTTLVQLLSQEEDIEVLASVSNGIDAEKMVEAIKPDVVLMDLQLPGQTGIDATRNLVEGGSKAAIVVLTHLSDDDSLFSAIKAGAVSYVLKDASLPQIADAVRGAAIGEGMIYPTLAPRVLAEFRRVVEKPEKQREIFQALSRREVEVLEMIAAGKRNKEIADTLFLSERTVKNHVGSILRKLQANDRTEAALIAAKHGLGNS